MSIHPALILVFTSFVSVNLLNAQQKLNLNDVLKMAVNRNSEVIKMSNNIKVYDADVKNNYGTLLPSLDVDYSWNWKKVRDSGGNKQIDYFGNETILGASETDTRQNSLKVGGSITLFDGLSAFAGIRHSKNALESAKLQLEKYKQDIYVQAAVLFYTVISNEKKLDVNSDNIKYNHSLLAEVKERNKLGMVPDVDVYSQEAQAANADLLFIQAKTEFEKAKIELLNFLAVDVVSEYEFTDDNSYSADTSVFNSDINLLFDEALNNRTDYKSAQLIVSNSYEKLKIARSGYYPHLTGSYSFGTSAVRIPDLFGRKTYGVGLSLNIPVFSNWSTETEVQSALVNIDNNLEELVAIERQIKSEVKTGLTEITSARASIEAADKSVHALEQNVKLQKERYELGTAPLTDVLLANRDYVNASHTFINAELNYMISYFTFLNYMGKINTGE